MKKPSKIEALWAIFDEENVLLEVVATSGTDVSPAAAGHRMEIDAPAIPDTIHSGEKLTTRRPLHAVLVPRRPTPTERWDWEEGKWVDDEEAIARVIAQSVIAKHSDPVQRASYEAKALEARRLLESGSRNDAPLLAAEADALGEDVIALAEKVLARAARDRDILVSIGASRDVRRRKAKR